MKDLLSLLCDCLNKKKTVALATVIHQEGSTPRGAGSKMIVDEKGLLYGTIGGGLAEAKAIQECMKALQNHQSHIMHFNLTGEMAAKSEMICGGLLNILIEPVLPLPHNINFFQSLLAHLNNHEAYVLTVLNDNKTIERHLCIDGQWHEDSCPTNASTITTPMKDSILAHIKYNKNSEFIKVEQNYIIEKYPPVWQMIIAGGGHISLFTAQAASMAGFSVTVLDDREEFAKPTRFPHAKATHVVPDFKHCFAVCPPTKYTCIVIVTRGHMHDKTVLAQSLNTKAGYIGMIGSKRKRTQVYDALLNDGFSQNQLQKVHCPIGLKINAETPEEIAICIVAQCIAHRREAWEILQA